MSRKGAEPARWTAADVGDQTGRTAIITGGNSGIGFEAARVLAARGATVVLACRDLGRADEAAARIAAEAGASGGRAETLHLDLASLASVRKAAGELGARHPRLDLLINNAGVMMPPHGRTEDGFELQIGTNHLGHFALTGLVLEHLITAARLAGGDREQQRPPGRPDQLRRPAAPSTATGGCAPTASPSWPT